MSIAIESSEELEQLRVRLRKMSDEELVRFGKAARSLCRDPRYPETSPPPVKDVRLVVGNNYGFAFLRCRLRVRDTSLSWADQQEH